MYNMFCGGHIESPRVTLLERDCLLILLEKYRLLLNKDVFLPEKDTFNYTKLTIQASTCLPILVECALADQA
jgi:hypothetical protein